MNPEIVEEPVTKSFYNKYYYRLEMKIVGSGFLRYPDIPISDQVVRRQDMNRSVNFGGSWAASRIRNPQSQDLALLSRIAECRDDFGSLKFRVEEPNLQVYAATEQELYKFVQTIKATGDYLTSISRPRNDQELELVKKGFTIKREEFEYPFKVHVREGRYHYQVRQQILNYLQNLGDEVKLPRNLIDSLSRNFDSVWNNYFYTKDKSILTMISLISPTFVRAVEEYTQVPSDK